jgi:hypothetical protein
MPHQNEKWGQVWDNKSELAENKPLVVRDLMNWKGAAGGHIPIELG